MQQVHNSTSTCLSAPPKRKALDKEQRHLLHVDSETFINTPLLRCWKRALLEPARELKVRVGAFISSTMCMTSGHDRKEKWGGYAPWLVINVLASYLQLVKGVGLFLIKSWLLCSTQEDLITFYVGVLDCLIITTFWPCSLPINSSEHPLLFNWFVTVTVNPDDGALA